MPTPPKVALVTGASSGIGAATARRLARDPGTELVLVARRGELLAELAASLPCPATWLAADLTDADAPERVRAHVEQHHDRLDLLVNNAGAAWRGTFGETGWANVQRHMELNFDAVVRLTEALLPLAPQLRPERDRQRRQHRRPGQPRQLGRLLGEQVRADRLDRRALARGGAARRPRRHGAARLRPHRGLPADRAARRKRSPA